MKKMNEWSLHTDENVRRLSSVVCWPHLPCAIALPKIKKDPNTLLPILENLKCDASLYVRKSVANNLNDIAKDHPEIVTEIARK
jgi:3-methyladenine DNA glycosylase AlkC